MQDCFSGLRKADVPHALCMHLTEKGLSLREAVWTASVWTARQSLSKNRDIKKTPQVDIAEDLSIPGIPISAHQCMVTPGG